ARAVRIIGVTSIFRLVVVARPLVKDGYAFGDIRAALLAEAQVQQEEAEVVKQRRLFRRMDSLWYRIWAGRAGRAFFRLAGIGLKVTGRPALPSVERTELVLGRSALAVYNALPAGERRQARDLPGVLERLETGAEALRAKRDTGESLTEAVAALEPLRLALVKRQSGVWSHSDRTLARHVHLPRHDIPQPRQPRRLRAHTVPQPRGLLLDDLEHPSRHLLWRDATLQGLTKGREHPLTGRIVRGEPPRGDRRRLTDRRV